jgi:urea carboxylase
MGQLKPGDTVRFRRLSLDQARALERAQEDLIARVSPRRSQDSYDSAAATSAAIRAFAENSRGDSNATATGSPAVFPAASFGPDRCILHEIPARGDAPEVRYRRSGDRNLLVEYGPPVLDLALRFRVHALMENLHRSALPGVLDLTPGIRSLQIHFDGRILPMEKLLAALVEAEDTLPDQDELEVPSRIVRMPISWDDEAIHAVIRKYMQSVRADAPWCPSNIEFIRRINGLESIEEVRRIIFDADFMVMGLGDVYLGAPVATPLDPRHRLVTTKYNPARTWTVENVVGIGGAYMCIYGMEGPGGYQLFGRTCQVWNPWRQTQDFREDKPWLLRFFDRIRFYPVSGEELRDFRARFPRGQASLEIEESTFRLGDYRRFLGEHAGSIAAFRTRQRAAFAEERERWKAAGSAGESQAAPTQGNLDVTQGSGTPVEAHISGNVWKVLVEPGQTVAADAPLLILESMKMEFTITAPAAGVVKVVLAREGIMVTAGQSLIYLES